ncbi:nucleotide sugar dehydrogenase [Candidatus Nitronereus thalassa]|uniref:Nucleotide sugar dehydrogenase n=1 Tax=Candidatus Nitronereus thalassa TaxID=3020898 RepID=A0ABU3K5L0_9BACT|nr:nucleotide sugar dehydrogenase [Candidatus Nitronereus thalassa]MDT7041647.1 nucleotide sugar dehydrogenase [Candidatus Nitronereus thalassa]
MSLLEKITDRSAVIGIVGLGYVGLPLAVLQTKTGYRVIGIDENPQKVDQVNKGKSYIGDVSDKDLAQAVGSKRFSASTDLELIAKCDVVLICVPTPLTLNKEPDIRAIVKVTKAIAQHAHPNMLVVLESTSYPGTTEEVILPKLTKKGLKVGINLYVAFSPERVDPGNSTFQTQNTFKLVGGVTPACCEIAKTFYEQSIVKIFPTTSTRVAEMTKVFENVFRSVNIALVNELAVLCDRMGINVFEVIDAAATKNFGFMPFYPGPGVGGHCIPLDPYYLAWKSKEYDLHTRFIELAGEINEGMPYFVVTKLQRILNQRKKCLNGASILVLGVTYKADTGDPRQSPATKVMELLQDEGAKLSYVDPFAQRITLGNVEYSTKKITPTLFDECDCALILTAHSCFDYDMIIKQAPLVFDTRNGTRHNKNEAKNVILL